MMKSKLSDLNNLQKEVLTEWGGGGFTVSYVSFELTSRYLIGGSFAPAHAFHDLVKSEGWEAHDTVPSLLFVAPEQVVKPELQQLSASGYVLESSGESIPFHANCSTKISLNDDGNLVFVNPDGDDDDSCVLNIDSLMNDAHGARREYNAALGEYEAQQEQAVAAEADDLF